MRSVQDAPTEPARDETESAGLARGGVVGAVAIALGASLVLQNAMLGWVEAPGYWDPMDVVLAFHAEHRVAVAVAVGSEAFNLPLLLVFLAGLHGLVRRRGGAGADWSRLAVAAGAAFSAAIALYAVLWTGVVLHAATLTEPSPLLELVWQMHAAAFAMAMPALGAVLVGAALATHASGLTRSWQRPLGVVGGVLLIAGGAGTLAIADGSTWLFVGMPGYAAWLVWLLATGVRLVRSGR